MAQSTRQTAKSRQWILRVGASTDDISDLDASTTDRSQDFMNFELNNSTRPQEFLVPRDQTGYEESFLQDYTFTATLYPSNTIWKRWREIYNKTHAFAGETQAWTPVRYTNVATGGTTLAPAEATGDPYVEGLIYIRDMRETTTAANAKTWAISGRIQTDQTSMEGTWA